MNPRLQRFVDRTTVGLLAAAIVVFTCALYWAASIWLPLPFHQPLGTAYQAWYERSGR